VSKRFGPQDDERRRRDDDPERGLGPGPLREGADLLRTRGPLLGFKNKELEIRECAGGAFFSFSRNCWTSAERASVGRRFLLSLIAPLTPG
jgi:hypothetical protein